MKSDLPGNYDITPVEYIWTLGNLAMLYVLEASTIHEQTFKRKRIIAPIEKLTERVRERLIFAGSERKESHRRAKLYAIGMAKNPLERSTRYTRNQISAVNQSWSEQQVIYIGTSLKTSSPQV